jgi:hypothetical protein
MIAEIILVPSPDLQQAPFFTPRKLASEVGINCETVRWYLRPRKPAISIAGSEEGAARKPAESPRPAQCGADPRSAPIDPGRPRPRSEHQPPAVRDRTVRPPLVAASA